MNGAWITALIGGGLAAAGLMAAVYAIAVPRRPALNSLMQLASHRPETIRRTTREATPDSGRDLILQRIRETVVHLLDRPWIKVRAADLAIVGRTRSAFLLERAGLSLLGLALPTVLGVVLWILGQPLPPAVPVLGAVVVATALWFVASSRLKAQADERRLEMRYAIRAYIRLVVMYRDGGAGAAASLQQAAEVSDVWAFRRINQQVAAAARSSRTVWRALQDLGDELDIDELSDLSAITEGAGIDGAHINSTMLARADSLGIELFADEARRASAATDRLLLPKIMLGLTTIAFLMGGLVATLFDGRMP